MAILRNVAMAGRRNGGMADRRTVGPSVAVAALILTIAHPMGSAAQTLGASSSPGGPQQPSWLTAWSPLAEIAELPRDLPAGGTSLPSLLTLPAPRVGLFWTAGNPGALPFDVSDSYAQIQAGQRRYSGEYRRPMDAGTDSRAGGAALGWTTLATNGAAIGRVVVERLHSHDGARANTVLPHSSNPFTVLDTLGDAMAGMVVRLEGAGGWRIGPLGVGAAVGYDGREVRTVESPVPRLDRVSATGVTGGLSYDIARGAVRIGVFGRRQQTAQTVIESAYAGGSLVYSFSGYFNPLPYVMQPGSEGLWRRSDRVSTAYGVSLGGRVRELTWAAFAEAHSATESQYIDPYDNDPATDDWDADGWAAGLEARAVLGDSAVLLALGARHSRLEGRALRMDLEDVNFEAEEQATNVTGEMRLLPRHGWGAALSVALGHEHRRRDDSLARIGSDLTQWAPAASVEISRTLPFGFSVSAAAAVAQHMPTGSIPNPARMSTAYQRWIAPEMSLYGTEASSRGGAVTLCWRSASGAGFWVRGSLASLSPESGGGRLQSVPDGSRSKRAVDVGVTFLR